MAVKACFHKDAGRLRRAIGDHEMGKVELARGEDSQAKNCGTVPLERGPTPSPAFRSLKLSYWLA